MAITDQKTVAPVVKPINPDIEHLTPVHKFVATLKGTADEVYGRLMTRMHARESHTVQEWRKLIDTYRKNPINPGR